MASASADELLRQMRVGVVHHPAIDERPAVEAFLRVAEEPDAHRRAGQKREDAADAGEQLAVDDDVERQALRIARTTSSASPDELLSAIGR